MEGFSVASSTPDSFFDSSRLEELFHFASLQS
jgi:hypothetical protein